MARGSGAGTGVIVALVVSVVCVIGLLTLTFMMYAGKTEAQRKQDEAESTLNDFVTNAERNADSARRVFALADQNRTSVYQHMNKNQQAVSSFVTGSPNTSLEDMRSQLQLAENAVVKNVITDLRRQLASSNNEIASLKRQINDLSQDNKSFQDRAAQAEANSTEKVAQVTNTFQGYSTATEQYRGEVDNAIQSINSSRQKLERDYRNKENDLQKRLDRSNQDNSVYRAQIDQLRKKTENYRIRPQSPAELVDGQVISVPATNQIFIDLGQNDRVVPGMTFEVYDSPASIRVDTNTNDYSRGKASIEIIRVSPDTATARVTRQVKGRPVVKGDVIANAVFNRNYRFKFLVHGIFDVDNNGQPTEAEGQYVRRRIIDWGGEVIDGQELTGDLDFLVLGAQPPMPAPLPPDAGDLEFKRYMERRAAREEYDRLFDQATKAQIPVLNWNRFEVLTGMNPR